MTTTDKVLTFNDIDEFDDTERAEVKAFGGTVKLSSLGADLMAEYLEERADPSSEGKRNVILAVYSMLTEEERALPKAERIALVRERAMKLKRKNLDSLAKITQKALDINGLSETAQGDRKNDLGETPSGVSPIVSLSKPDE